MKVVLFAGAGVSAELGVPAMRQLAEAFRDHLRDSGYAPETVSSLDRQLEATDYDMESVIDDLDNIVAAQPAAARWGVGDGPQVSGLEAVRAEAEWLISHVCERVEARRSFWLWGPMLRQATPATLTLATTNYDRAVEQAALQTGTALADGFPDFGSAELVQWNGFGSVAALKLLKVHGSTDWYHQADSPEVWKLRHAMPLYGGVRVSTEGAADIQLKSALVLPSREKIVSSPPYPALQYEFRKAVEASDLVAIVGSSLRDPDLLDIAKWSAASRPTLVVTRSLRAGSPGVSIRMSASRFLISLLPRLIGAGTAEEAGSIAEKESGQTELILGPYSIAMDVAELPAARCNAIDALTAARVSLPGNEIEALLNDASKDVATFSLGLIRDSPASATLTTVAMKLAAEDASSGFAREARLLAEVASG